MRLSIVIPVFNAENTIEALCNRLFDLYSSSCELEIVLVNDNSQDSTHTICSRLHRSRPDTVTYVRLSRNFGEHSAVMAGLNVATGDFCVVMDDDFQNPPEEVGRLVEEIGKGYDVVYTRYAEKRDSLFRNMGSRLNDKVANIVLRKPADLYLSSFKIMNRFLVDEIIKYTGPDPYIDAIILRTTASIGKIEVRHDARRHGRSGYTFMKLVSLWGNMVIGCSLIPLRILGVVGLVMTAAGVYIGGEALVDYLIPHLQDPSEYRVIMSYSVFSRGFLLLCLSVVGEYVGRIYLSLNSDPQFVIRERLSVRRKLMAAATTEERRKGYDAALRA
ncbi:glycosyltransferase family 2 protein [Geobacter sp. DSM 9736]|uniref:glycosyltransferase family 2 protein n=1 Tax=Geobacter sp. DSM 9736 TaxID=1277350 RepID=UPI000B50DB6F|nr:glycosyltransferase family 2 protein [Geobacter sp. DSM 9736]SNB44902.1 undecaprenyl-phosphate 4-deoxy-4-formamido-L-arabinose transferase [Geobacter sp. DSM 9736]